ncbi:MAG: hypothetical protein ACT4QF_15805, partial [Sporichthyaceae bacterium]
PSGLRCSGPSQVPISQPVRASRRYGTLNSPTAPGSSVDPGLAAASRIAKLDPQGVSKNVRTDVALLVKSIRREASDTFSPSDIGAAPSEDIAGVLEDDCDLHRKALEKRGPALDF